jgi:PAS domain S-box-containing protein
LARSPWYFESLDRLSEALAGTGSVDAMIHSAVAVVQEVFDADRAWLDYPCDPDAEQFIVPVEITKPEFPGLGAVGEPVSMSAGMAQVMRQALTQDQPLVGPGTRSEDGPFESAVAYGVRSRMWMAIHPRDDQSWLFGIHQCAFERVWSEEERQLFHESGRRIADAITIRLLVARLRDDVEKRKQTEQALQESETRFRDFASAAADWFWETDSEDRFTNIIGTFRDGTHTGVQKWIGKTRYEMHAENPLMPDAAWLELRAKVLRREAFQNFRIPMHDARSGARFVSEINGRPVYDGAGKFLGYRGTGRDISKEVEASAREQALESQLRQGQKLQAIGELTGGIAHDFNNILAIVLGFTDLATHHIAQHPDATLERYLHEISRAGTRGRDLVSQMLTFSRGGTGNPQPTMFETVVVDAVRMLKPMIPPSVEIRLDGIAADGGRVPLVLADPLQMMQVVLNLCLNSVDALRGHGEIRISLKATSVEDSTCASCHQSISGSVVELSVRDNGSGIAAETLPRVFDPFFSTKAENQGAGMGLSVVHGMVHDAGGHISLSTTEAPAPDQGTSFTITLPVHVPAPEGRDKITDRELAPTGFRPGPSSMRVLLVDDVAKRLDTGQA